MNIPQIIAKKRDGCVLTEAEISFFIGSYSRGDLPDYQMSAMAMAIFCRGMNNTEVAWLTEQMLRSGVVMQWPAGSPVVDKHSTGGIGDKVSIVLAPLLACFDLRVPMISGRGLGPSGGTLDKLEAIPGFRTNLTLDEIYRVTNDVGCVITGATAEIAPADQKLYALRDVTGTVPSIPLITASIMSKKLAENLSDLVLDVKFGNGAFMKTRELATELAQSLVAVGTRMGVNTTALLTDMNQPLGEMIGNSVEVIESLELLRGQGPEDVRNVTIALASQLLVATNCSNSLAEASQSLVEKLNNGQAFAKYEQMVTAQNGEFDAPLKVAAAHALTSTQEGIINAFDTEAIGYAVIELGGGRTAVGQAIDHSVGLKIHKRIGQSVGVGEPLATVYAKSHQFESIADKLRACISIGEEATPIPELIVDRVVTPA